MNSRKQRLELTWIGKDERPRLEPRILLEESEKSYHAKTRVTGGDIFDNILIHGDNLLALKALEQEYAGAVKCIYIDPPFNIDAATPYYDDGLAHSEWLSLMRPRLELLRNLLRSDGLIFVHIDDEEVAYLTVLMDEVFGRQNRQNIVAVKMSEATGVKMSHARKRFPKTKEFILVYKRDAPPSLSPVRIPLEAWNTEYKEILLGASESQLEELKELMEESPRSETDVSLANAILSGVKIQSLSAYFRENGTAGGEQDAFRWDNAWRIVQAVGAGSLKERAIQARVVGQDLSAVLSAQKKLYIFKTAFEQSSRDPRIRVIFADKYLQYNPGDFWTDIKTTGGVGQEGGVHFPKGKKPEQLLRRIIGTCTAPGDLVLDSFAGSGTTGAVAHKMRRRWIMVELGDHCDSHVLPRMTSVVDGTDATGVSEVEHWKGGGGFRYYSLAPSLLEKDAWDNWVIAPEFYDPAKLSQAVCKLMGFTYQPSESHYWMQGRSTETDFIYVTTQSLTHEQLAAISDEVGDERTLLVCCKAFHANAESFSNLTIKKIPQAVLRKCEWGKDDYSFNIADLPSASPEADDPEPAPPVIRKRGNGKSSPQDRLFNEEGGE